MWRPSYSCGWGSGERLEVGHNHDTDLIPDLTLPPQATAQSTGRAEWRWIKEKEHAMDMLGEVKQERKKELREKLRKDIVGISQQSRTIPLCTTSHLRIIIIAIYDKK